MVAALQWVKENISNFGGDQDNVTIMGQSGGGAKVCTPAAMHKAEGLFHRAVSLSGSTIEAREQVQSQLLGEYIMREAGLVPSQIDQLQEIPWQEYILLANRANQKMREETGGQGMIRGGFGPVADGINIPKEPFYYDPKGVSSNVPMLICSTFHEWGIARTNPELEILQPKKQKRC